MSELPFEVGLIILQQLIEPELFEVLQSQVLLDHNKNHHSVGLLEIKRLAYFSTDLFKYFRNNEEKIEKTKPYRFCPIM